MATLKKGATRPLLHLGPCIGVARSNFPSYWWYGKQGVKVDPRWNDFATFLADIGERPHPSSTLDRYPNKTGDYEPNNVRWATRKQQAENRQPYPPTRKTRRTPLNKYTIAELETELANVARIARIPFT
jgi:hypothetical protein